MTISLSDAMKKRRSIYAISGESPIPDDRIVELVGQAMLHVPSAFNGQSARVVVLLGKNHKKLWNITKETLRKIIPADKFGPTESKIASFSGGHGTILFFDDTAVTDGLAEKFPTYRENFKIWAEQANGMLQYTIWISLEAEGLGASLQHYNPLIDDEVKAAWDLPQRWRLIAQMPFGKPTAEAGEKTFVPLSERLRVL